MLVPFVQFEFAGLIGLPDGRYLSREDGSEQVLIVEAIGAPRPSRRARRRPRPVAPAEAEAVPLTRVTVAGAERFEDRSAARRWLEATVSEAERRGAVVRSATVLLNRALAALRAEARDPLIQELGATRALAVRIGFGQGDELADGRWTEARELPPPHRGRREDVDPQSRVAAVLGGRDEVHPAETLLQRARLDIQQGRPREAALGLRAAADALAQFDGPRNDDLRAQLAEAERKLQS